jgi:hypothetical protein
MEVAADLLQKPKFCDWTSTAVFYSALHIVEAVLSSSKHTLTKIKHGHDHHGREVALKYTNSFTEIWKHYRQLQSISQVARYLENSNGTPTLFETYLSAEQVAQVVIKKHFGGMIQSATRFLHDVEAKSIKDGFESHFQSVLSTQRS